MKYKKPILSTFIITLFLFNYSHAATVTWWNYLDVGYPEKVAVSYAILSTDKDTYYPGEEIIIDGYAQRNDATVRDTNAAVGLGTSLGGICESGNWCAGTLRTTIPSSAPIGKYIIYGNTCWYTGYRCTSAQFSVDIVPKYTPPPIVNIRFELY